MFKLLIYNTAGVSTDYTGNLIPGWSIQEGLNVPSTFTFNIAPIGRSFVAPSQRAYVKLYSTITGKSLFTGFISSAPTLTFMGLSPAASASASGQLLTYGIVATSDEYLLNVKAVPFIPAFVNQRQGAILEGIAEVLCPGFFDTSQIAAGDLVPYFAYDPSQSWCEIAKNFADASRYRYKAKDKVLQYQPYGDADFGIAYDESQKSNTFSTKDLSTTVMTVPIVNDVTIIGGVEAGDNHEDYFLGDGGTANFPLWHEVFHGYSSLQLQDAWNGTGLNTTNWYQWGPPGFFNYSAGALNVIDVGPSGSGSTLSPMPPLGDSFLSANNGIELAGGVDVQTGEVSFNDTCFGMLGGVYTGEDMTAADFVAGFAIASPNGVVFSSGSGPGPIPGAPIGVSGVLIQPSGVFAGVGYAGPQICTQWNHDYVLQMVMNAPVQSRYTQAFRTLNGQQFGGEETEMTGSVTWYVQDYDIAASVSPTGFFYMPTVTSYTVSNVQLPAFALFGLVNNQQLNITIGGGSAAQSGTMIASSPVGSLFSMNGPLGLFTPTGSLGVLPMLPPGSGGFIGGVQPWLSQASGNILPGPYPRDTTQTAQVLGNGIELQAAQITEQSSTDTLAFYAQTTPAAGTPVRFQSWEAQAAVSRLQDGASITAESLVVGDDGIRSAIVANLNPLPETSEDCDNAAQAFLVDRSAVDYNGTYNCTSQFFDSPTVAFSSTAFAQGSFDFAGIPQVRFASFSVVSGGFVMDQVILTLSSPATATGSLTLALYGSVGGGPAPAPLAVLVMTINDVDLTRDPSQYIFNSFPPQSLAPGLYWVAVGTANSAALWWTTENLTGYGASGGYSAWIASSVMYTQSNAGAGFAFQMQVTGTGHEGMDFQYYPTAGRFLYINAPARGIVGQNMLVSALTISDLDMKTELVTYQVTFGADMHLEKLLQHFVNPYPTSILTTKDTANPPDPRLTQNVDNSYLADLHDVQIDMNSISATGCNVVVNDNYSGVIEIRSSDTNWGLGNTANLLAQETVTGAGSTFALPRTNMDVSWFMRALRTTVVDLGVQTAGVGTNGATIILPAHGLVSGDKIINTSVRPAAQTRTVIVIDAFTLQVPMIFGQVAGQSIHKYHNSTITSRRSKVLRLYWPMQPMPPFLESLTPIVGTYPDSTSFPSTALQFNYQGDQRAVYGFELRVTFMRHIGGPQTFVLVQCFATYGSMYIDLTQTPYYYLQASRLLSAVTLQAYFFNAQWDYSAPLVLDPSSFPTPTGAGEGPVYVITPLGTPLTGTPHISTGLNNLIVLHADTIIAGPSDYPVGVSLTWTVFVDQDTIGNWNAIFDPAVYIGVGQIVSGPGTISSLTIVSMGDGTQRLASQQIGATPAGASGVYIPPPSPAITTGSIYFPPTYDTFTPPAAGAWYTDPVFGKTILRVSDAYNMPDAANPGSNLTWIGTEYGSICPFGEGNTYLILVHTGYFGLYDGLTGQYVKDLPLEVSASSEPRWSHTDSYTLYYHVGNVLKKIDVATLAITVVHTFSEYTAIYGNGESDISYDGDHFVLCGDSRYVFIYTISTDTKSPVFDASAGHLDGLKITPNNNVLVSWSTPDTLADSYSTPPVAPTRYMGIELFDSSMTFLRQVAHADGHCDTCLDTDGVTEVMLWANSDDSHPSSNNGIVKVKLSDGSQTTLVSLDWTLAVDISTRDITGGYAFVTTYAPSNPDTPGAWVAFDQELLRIKLDGTEILRMAHHRSRPYGANTYNWQPKMTCSRDGTRIVFSSDYDLQVILGRADQYIDVYMIVP